MIRRLLLLLSVALLPAWAGALAIIVPDRPDAQPIEIASQKLATVIRGGIAETTIDMVFGNPHGFPLEGTFLMPVPRDAQATRFAMQIDGKEVEAALLERDEARRIYSDIVRRMRDPGLMEWVDERTFRVQVFPIPPHGEMPVSVTLVQPLARTGDWQEFNYPDVRRGMTAPVGKTEFSLRIEEDGPIASVWSPTHRIDTAYAKEHREAAVKIEEYKPGEGRALSVCFTTETKGAPLAFSAYRPRKDEPGWFLLMAEPSGAEAKKNAVPYVATFVFDTSGSMNQEGKIDQAKKALVQCLGALRAGDRFNIVTFATGVETFASEPRAATAENVAEARAYIESIRAQGGTNIAQALETALAQDTGDALHQIVFVTDGRPTVGATQTVQILGIVSEKAKKPTRIFSLGVGYDVNAHLLDSLGTETRALSDYIAPGEEIETKVAGFFDAISAPVATNVELAVDGVRISDIHPSPIPDLFAGRALMVLGRYDKDGKATVALQGRNGDGAFERKIDVEFPASTNDAHRHVATLWAGRRIAFLIDESRRKGESEELRDEAVALSKEYGIPTPWTSYLAMDDNETNGRATAPVPRLARSIGPYPLPAPDGQPPIKLGAQVESDAFGAAVSFSSATSFDVESGEAAVNISRQRNSLDRAANSAQLGSGMRTDSTVRSIAGRTFRNDDGKTWREENPAPDCKIERVEYLSAAWFALHEDAPEIRGILEIGENVEFRFGDVCIAVGPSGRNTTVDAQEIIRAARAR